MLCFRSLKFTKEGKVLSYRLAPGDEVYIGIAESGRRSCDLRRTRYGSAFPPKTTDIFEPFQQADEPLTAKRGDRLGYPSA